MGKYQKQGSNYEQKDYTMVAHKMRFSEDGRMASRHVTIPLFQLSKKLIEASTKTILSHILYLVSFI